MLAPSLLVYKMKDPQLAESNHGDVAADTDGNANAKSSVNATSSAIAALVGHVQRPVSGRDSGAAT
jgi:hypothetical protein